MANNSPPPHRTIRSMQRTSVNLDPEALGMVVVDHIDQFIVDRMPSNGERERILPSRYDRDGIGAIEMIGSGPFRTRTVRRSESHHVNACLVKVQKAAFCIGNDNGIGQVVED